MPLQTVGSPLAWGLFLLFVLGMLALDLGVFHKTAHEIKLKEATFWSAFWISLAVVFNGVVWFFYGGEKALQFGTGYLIEKALSVDNIFVFVVLFSAFAIPASAQHRVLFWGILGALVMRAIFIFVGGALMQKFHAMVYIFGGLLLVTGVKLYLERNAAEKDPADNAIVKLVRRFVPVTHRFEGMAFTVVENGKRVATPLLLALIAVELTDVIFAVDSIPAIFAITTDPFIVFTSNIFAILGLRSLYFLLASVIDRFRELKVGLSFVLVFVGLKMLFVDVYKVPVLASLCVIATLLTASIVVSLIRQRRAMALLVGPG